MSYMLLLIAWLATGSTQAAPGHFCPTEEACKSAADEVMEHIEASKDDVTKEGVVAVRVMCVPVSNPETEQKS